MYYDNGIFLAVVSYLRVAFSLNTSLSLMFAVSFDHVFKHEPVEGESFVKDVRCLV